MPRRYIDYPDAFAGWNLVSSIGAYISTAGLVVSCYAGRAPSSQEAQARRQSMGRGRDDARMDAAVAAAVPPIQRLPKSARTITGTDRWGSIATNDRAALALPRGAGGLHCLLKPSPPAAGTSQMSPPLTNAIVAPSGEMPGSANDGSGDALAGACAVAAPPAFALRASARCRHSSLELAGSGGGGQRAARPGHHCDGRDAGDDQLALHHSPRPSPNSASDS